MSNPNLKRLICDGSTKRLYSSASTHKLYRWAPFNIWVDVIASDSRSLSLTTTTTDLSYTAMLGRQTAIAGFFNADNGWRSGSQVLSYGGWRVAPYKVNVYAHSEAFEAASTYYFSTPKWCDGHEITAARVVLYSPAVMWRYYNKPTGPFNYSTLWPISLRIRSNVSMLTPTSILSSDYVQVTVAQMNAATSDYNPGIEAFDLWNTGTPSRTIPVCVPAPTLTWNLNANAIASLNTNRVAWIGAAFTQDQFSAGIADTITAASLRGIKLQIYVE